MIVSVLMWDWEVAVVYSRPPRYRHGTGVAAVATAARVTNGGMRLAGVSRCKVLDEAERNRGLCAWVGPHKSGTHLAS